MDEAQWAIDMYAEAKSRRPERRFDYVAAAHQQAGWSAVSGQDRKVHELFMGRPLAHLQSVYREIFEEILGQRVSKAGPRLAQASIRLDYARKTGRPILFVLHDGNTWSNPAFSATTQSLIGEFVVIVMPLRESPALSQLTGQPPFEATSSARPLFVVARSDCRQLASVAGWYEHELSTGLAMGWADALERKPTNIRSLVRAQRLLRKANPESADRVRELTIRVQQEQRAAREAAKQPLPKLAAR